MRWDNTKIILAPWVVLGITVGVVNYCYGGWIFGGSILHAMFLAVLSALLLGGINLWICSLRKQATFVSYLVSAESKSTD